MSVSDLTATLSNLNPSKIIFIQVLMRVLVDFGHFNYHQLQQGDGYLITNFGRLFVKNDPSSKRTISPLPLKRQWKIPLGLLC
ncbi:hypothetical protein P3S68_007552 [Capsicum galapagoense]